VSFSGDSFQFIFTHSPLTPLLSKLERSTMLQDRMKAIFWLCLFKSFQPGLAGRRSFWDGDESRTFARLGRLQLSRDAAWRRGGKTQEHGEASHYLDLPTSLNFEDGSDLDFKEVRPVSIRALRGEAPSETPSDESLKNHELSVSVSSPIIPSAAFDEMTGEEFGDPETVDRLARSGFEMCTQEGSTNQWIDFKAHKDTEKLLQEQDMMTALDQGEVLVYIGKAKQEGCGSHLPIIKTKSILPLSAQEMAELLLDSSRVKIYNKLSLGRKDVRILGEYTKIVCNLTKPPIAKSQMVSVTLMHSRPLEEEDQASLDKNKEGYLVVSRAVPGMMDEDLAELPRNDILLGVNLLQDLGPNECLMTAVTHVYSPALPTMLARGMGVSSAINFVKDIRRACQPVAR
jgi:hypothetical protein